MDLTEIREKTDNMLADLLVVRRQQQEEYNSLAHAENHLVDVDDAQLIVQQVAQTVQQQAHDKIAGVVSRCLETVFDDANYGFRIDFEKKRGRTEAKLVLLKDGHDIGDPLEADSGGVVDVAAFALRLACLVLAKPLLRKVVILDEPFKFVSVDYRQNVRMLLEGLARDFGVQFIMVTHDKAYQCGTVVDL